MPLEDFSILSHKSATSARYKAVIDMVVINDKMINHLLCYRTIIKLPGACCVYMCVCVLVSMCDFHQRGD